MYMYLGNQKPKLGSVSVPVLDLLRWEWRIASIASCLECDHCNVHWNVVWVPKEVTKLGGTIGSTSNSESFFQLSYFLAHVLVIIEQFQLEKYESHHSPNTDFIIW